MFTGTYAGYNLPNQAATSLDYSIDVFKDGEFLYTHTFHFEFIPSKEDLDAVVKPWLRAKNGDPSGAKLVALDALRGQEVKV